MYLEPGDFVCIETGSKDYIQPFDETDETFMERLNRCTPKRNVFLKEWPEDNTNYDDMIL